MPPKDKYTDPKLRDEIKEELKQSDKGGEPGKWSARKAQMMAKEYKNRGGSYTTDKSQQDESQKNLEQWTEEEWQTKEGSGHAKKDDGTQKRYLPKKAWEKMTEEEKKETDHKKQEGSKAGKGKVDNTPKAKQSRKNASEEEAAGSDDEERDSNRDEEEAPGNDEDDDQKASGKYDGRATRANAGRKRKATQQSDDAPRKQQKSSSGSNTSKGKVGSKHMDATEPAPRGSVDRLPKTGQHITWKAMPGYVDGKVKEILTRGKTVDGKSVKASRNDPKIVLVSNSSGKICVHKPDACFYE